MRHRFKGARHLDADAVARIFTEAHAANVSASPEVRRYAVKEALAAYGYSPLDAIRVRYLDQAWAPEGLHLGPVTTGCNRDSSG